MFKTRFVYLFALGLLLVSQASHASFIFTPSLSYLSESVDATEPNTVSTETTQLRADLRFGFIFPNGWFLGAMYAYISDDCDPGSCTDQTGSYARPTIGYFALNGFYTMITYHVTGGFSGDNLSSSGATGPQADFGWVFPVANNLAIGPQVTYRSIEMSETQPVERTRTRTGIAPYLNFYFIL